MAFTGSLLAASSSVAQDSPCLIPHDRVMGCEGPTRGIIVKKQAMKVWTAAEQQVVAWCFYGAVNVARVDDVYWAVNGLARARVKTHQIFTRGQRRPIEDMDKTVGPQREFLFTLNDRMNDACP